MKLFRKLAVSAVIVGAAMFAAPAAAQATGHSTPASTSVDCAQGGQYSAGQVGLINLGNLGLSVSALNNPAVGLLGFASSSDDDATVQACGNN